MSGLCDHKWEDTTPGMEWCVKCGLHRTKQLIQPEHADIEMVLTEREKTHGRFEDQAQITGRLKSVLIDSCAARGKRGQSPLTVGQYQSLDMIAVKIGRIIAGDPNFADHWADIAGYAMLGARKSPSMSQPTKCTHPKIQEDIYKDRLVCPDCGFVTWRPR